MERSQELAQSKRSYLIAAAGCGKTHLIAEAVAKHAAGLQLILTHTHAGIDALRRKLRALGASPSSFHLDTIAGWALRYAVSFPATSGLTVTKPKNAEWVGVYEAAAKLLSRARIHEIVRASYTGVYVDEYQDCTVEQHKLILKLADILPCRILGDPLQGIFGFGSNVLVNWDTDIAGNFERLADLSTPWRWKQNGPPELGDWLQCAREKIQNGQPIDLMSVPPKAQVRWVCLPSNKNMQYQLQLKTCREMRNEAGNILAVHQWEPQCNKLVNFLAPMYGNIETIECDDLMKSAEAISSSTGIDRVDAVVEFAAKCLTGVHQELGTILKVLHKGRGQAKPYKRQIQLNLLQVVLNTNSLALVLPAIEGIKAIPGVTAYRRELYFAMCQSLREFATGKHDTLADAAWAVRNRTSRVGRKIRRRTIGRTLLVKGLEFDHCLLLNADSLRARDLYVAITRATQSLTILSGNPILKTAAN
jgi:hypothetical protein